MMTRTQQRWPALGFFSWKLWSCSPAETIQYIYRDKQSTGQKLTTTVKKEQNKSGQNPTAMRIWDVGFCIYFQDGADVQKPT